MKKVYFLLFSLIFFLMSCSDIFNSREEFADVDIDLGTVVARQATGNLDDVTFEISFFDSEDNLVDVRYIKGTKGKLARVKYGNYLLHISGKNSDGTEVYAGEQRIKFTQDTKNVELVVESVEQQIPQNVIISFDELKKAIGEFNNNATETSKTFVINSRGEDVVFDGVIEIKNGKNVTINGADDEIFILTRSTDDEGYKGSLFKVESGASLAIGIENGTIIIDGAWKDNNGEKILEAEAPLIYSEGNLTIGGVCELRNNYNGEKNSRLGGGAIYMSPSQSSPEVLQLVINGGIMNCGALQCGAGLSLQSVNCTLVGAKILKNSVKEYDFNGTKYSCGGGIFVSSSAYNYPTTITIGDDTEFSGNSAIDGNAIYLSDGSHETRGLNQQKDYSYNSIIVNSNFADETSNIDNYIYINPINKYKLVGGDEITIADGYNPVNISSDQVKKN